MTQRICKICNSEMLKDDRFIFSDYYCCHSCGRYQEQYSVTNKNLLLRRSVTLKPYIIDIYDDDNFSDIYNRIESGDSVYRGNLICVFNFIVPVNITLEKLKALMVLQ